MESADQGSPDPDLVLAENAAVAAASFARRFLGKHLETRIKTAPGDVVTEADVGAEALVREMLSRERPQDGLLGEEGSSVEGRRRWLIDAIDGTLNFVRGDPFWCSAVALEDGTGPVVAAVHHVASGATYTARRGQGCWLNGNPLHLSSDTPLGDSVLATYLHPGDGRTAIMEAVLDGVASMRARGSGTLELAWLAEGRIDVWLQRDVSPWDRAPGMLLVTEAGGTCGDLRSASGLWSYAAASGRAAHELVSVMGAVGEQPKRSPDTPSR